LLAFPARETLTAASGLDFSARARLGPLPVTTQDRYQDGRADSRIRLLGVLPIVSKRGPMPTGPGGRERVAALHVPPRHRRRLVGGQRGPAAHLPVHGEAVHASLRIGPAGQLHDLRLERSSDLTDDHAYTLIPFQSWVQAERSFDDYTIPSQLHAVWWAGTDREFQFFRATVQQATFSP
jgi:hypothetical protein